MPAVYGTIAVTSVVVIYDGWVNVTVLGAITVILGPVVAIAIGHTFAASLAAYTTSSDLTDRPKMPVP